MIEPPDDGLADVVSRYCVVKFAVNVALEFGATRLWETAPLSLQPVKTYRVPPVPCGDAAAIV